MHKGLVFVVAERIRGDNVSVGWGLWSEESRAKILYQLKGMIAELRALCPAGSSVANVDGGPVCDCRLPAQPLRGPFKTIRDFYRHLRGGVEAHEQNLLLGVYELIDFHEQAWPQPVFTHGDLSSFKILVDGDKVVGIVDWETAGWLPSY